MNFCIWVIDAALTGITLLGQSGAENNSIFSKIQNWSVIFWSSFVSYQGRKKFQVLLSNTNNSIQHYSFVYAQLNGFMYSKWLNNSILTIDGTLTDTTTPGQSRHGGNGCERVLHIPQSSRTGASRSDNLVSYLGHLLE